VKYILIALGVVVFLWLISVIISKSDRRTRERYIEEKQKQLKKEEEEKARKDQPDWTRK
jgi:type VI protein secretion system component VasK